MRPAVDTRQFVLDNDSFALRDNERMTLLDERPESGRFIAVMARSASFPEGPHVEARHSDGQPVEFAAILACIWSKANQAWQWSQITPPSKERIGDLMFDSGCDRDRWYYVALADEAEAGQQ